jgi:DNA-directed RNA polymerase sigma subunit (sigma70/sigma32)
MVIDHNRESENGIKIYLREIGQIPLLTPQDEIRLAARIKRPTIIPISGCRYSTSSAKATSA